MTDVTSVVSKGWVMRGFDPGDASASLQTACQGDGRTTAEGGGQLRVVCQVLHGLRIGGAEVLAARLARGLCGSYRFLFACLDELGTLGEALKDEGFPVHVIGRRPGADWSCALRLASLMRRERVDLLHAHQYTPFFYGTAARLIYRRPPVLFTEHGRTFPDYPRPKRIIANRILLRRCDRVIGVGETVRRALVDNEGFPPTRVGVIYNGIDLAPFRDPGRDRNSVRRELDLDDGDFVIAQVARLDSLKDHATAIRMLERVATACTGARLVIVGEGPELSTVQGLIEGRGLESNVRILGLRGDVARLLAAADIGLLTSVSEGIPLALIEAMAAGLAVVSTYVGGVREVVEAGVTGLLVPAGDDAALAEAVLRLAGDASLRVRMGRLGRERAGRNFSELQMHNMYCNVYKEMFENNGAWRPQRTIAPQRFDLSESTPGTH
jgi:glycosyltransferase involved in cell wall biosynthesis